MSGNVTETSKRTGGENRSDDSGNSGEGVKPSGEKKPLLILDYPSVMFQLNPMHLRELTKHFEVVLVGRTDDLTKEDLESMRISAASFYYEYPDAEAREKFRQIIRSIIKEFKESPTCYFSSMHWWAMEEASKCTTILVPTPAVREIARAIARNATEQISILLEKYTIKIVK